MQIEDFTYVRKQKAQYYNLKAEVQTLETKITGDVLTVTERAILYMYTVKKCILHF